MTKFSAGREIDEEQPGRAVLKRHIMACAHGPSRSSKRITYRIANPEFSKDERKLEIEDDEEEIVKAQGSVKSETDEHVSMTLIDPEVFDCFVCCEPLSIPVFQCDNGHVACAPCCTKLLQKCPSCSLPIGHSRCRAMEKVLDSILISCPNKAHGCDEMTTFCKKSEHEENCFFKPCSCPVEGCDYVSSSPRLSQHFTKLHSGSAMPFSYNRTFAVSFSPDDELRVLQEETDGTLFVLINSRAVIGNVVSVCYIGSSLLARKFLYEVIAKRESCKLRFQSVTTNMQSKKSSTSLPDAFLLVPPRFFASPEQICLDLCIWQ